LSGGLKSDYVFFNGQRIARFDPKTLAVHYYFSNHLGSHVVVPNATGVCEQDIEYYPYGGQRKQYCATPVAENYKFTGKERDSESSLDYFGARHYASSLGRYLRPDAPFADQRPEDPQSWNLYSYVRNNPLNATDPSGHECVSNGNGGWQWSGSGETCEDVDAQNKEYKQLGQASATVNGCEGEGAASCLGAMVSDLTSTSSLSEVGVNGILGAQAAEGALELPGLFRSGWDLLSGWRMASKMAGVRAAGEAGELAAGIIKSTERISSSTGSADESAQR
jgi:RHS repeat-associated protein